MLEGHISAATSLLWGWGSLGVQQHNVSSTSPISLSSLRAAPDIDMSFSLKCVPGQKAGIFLKLVIIYGHARKALIWMVHLMPFYAGVGQRSIWPPLRKLSCTTYYNTDAVWEGSCTHTETRREGGRLKHCQVFCQDTPSNEGGWGESKAWWSRQSELFPAKFHRKTEVCKKPAPSVKFNHAFLKTIGNKNNL